ncbi:MAG: aminomethyl-transferring glycine dehydrogenase subunit GcvPA [Clostridiales bacterium]|nr:aminomethyl-transferring glycine dehydrogenase subunit GcvPA [Clostridiales bacterium]MDR2713411.1 aminomethyl-transferring glycine dehydrogenase subunit GcvPA [Clostridiales bacterium]
MKKNFIHPYMPNSAPKAKNEMLKELGVNSIEDLYLDLIPDQLLFKQKMALPEPILSEYALKKHVEKILAKNTTCDEYISFLGAGCYRHFVPAVCTEIMNRAEFLTAYCGDTYSDHGKMQAIFEYTSMLGEILDLDVVSYTCYDAGQAVSSSLRMALRISAGKGQKLLLPASMNPEILSQARSYCEGYGEIVLIDYDKETGLLDIDHLKSELSPETAAVFLENPAYFGGIEQNVEEIARLTHDLGAIFIVMPDLSSLGVMESPANYGADIVCGDIQPFGMNIQYGGGCAGFIAVRQEEKYINEIPTYLYGIAKTQNEGEYGWGRAINARCSHGSREKAKEYFGTATGLWAITAGVYMASLGPCGIRELGETILQKTAYAIKELAKIPFITAGKFKGFNFREFIINFDKCKKTVKEINQSLLEYHIFGGKDLSKDFPALGQSALYCLTEITSAEDIHKLTQALTEIVSIK